MHVWCLFCFEELAVELFPNCSQYFTSNEPEFYMCIIRHLYQYTVVPFQKVYLD